MQNSRLILRVAVPNPLRRFFDYFPIDSTHPLVPGVRVRVPFGHREVIGIIIEVTDTTLLPRARVKPVIAVLDETPVISAGLLDLLKWAAEYYHHPPGEVLHSALPVLLRQGRAAIIKGIDTWHITSAGRERSVHEITRAPVQQSLLKALEQHSAGLSSEQLARLSPGWRKALRALIQRGWVSMTTGDCLQHGDVASGHRPALNSAQTEAVATISKGLGDYGCYLLHGITGSGKTEVYLHLIERMLRQERQVLVLAPEIGLTPQLVDRFRQRFQVPVAVLHSGLTDQERLCAWLMARAGKAPIILGTRSAVFTPMKRPGLIIVDEEHDQSYKQQDGFRYHARDVAIMRASREHIPIVLGSATPSLESLKNVLLGNYLLLDLPDRAGEAGLPDMRVLDMRRLAVHDGLSHPLLEQIQSRLDKGEQSLIFLNRRGFAPVWMCYDCGWVAPCARCDARLTLHKQKQRLRCHHCGVEQPVMQNCPQCAGSNLHPLGEGTERVESALARAFPRARILRIDRDSTRRKGALQATLQKIYRGEVDILIGTQMLSKGHDFPMVTLVGVINADQGLYSSDFRSGEFLFQQIMQVSGRAGRGDRRGQVLIQTYHPQHPVFAALCRHDYRGFADYALDERRQTDYPPYSYMALLRAESSQLGSALRFMQEAYSLGEACRQDAPIQVMEPVPAPMERRAGRHRAQLLVQAGKRGTLHDFLRHWLPALEQSRLGKRVRWSLDVDPLDMY